MSNIVEWNTSIKKEEKLTQLSQQLDACKDALAQILEEYDSQHQDLLTEALDALTDACEGILEVLED